MGHVIPVILALGFCVMVSITVAIPLNSERMTPDCGYQQLPEEKYSWEKLNLENYHTIDPNDLKDLTVGVLKAEHIDNYQTEEQTMDLSNFNGESKNKSMHHEIEDTSGAESINSESKISNDYVPDQLGVEDEKIITIVKNVQVPYPVEKTIPYPVVKKIPYPVKVPVAQPYPIEKPIPYPVKVIVKIPMKIPHPYIVYKNTPYAVQVPIERRIPHRVYIPDPYPVEKKIHYEVQVPVPEPFPIERNLFTRVKVPIAVPQPFPVEKRVHYPVEVKVDRPVAVPISKPYPVQVIKPVPYPVYKERRIPVEVKVDRPVPYPVYKPMPYSVKIPVIHPFPVEKKVPFTVIKNIPYPVEIPVERPIPIHIDKHIDTHLDEHKYDIEELPQANKRIESVETKKNDSVDNSEIETGEIKDELMEIKMITEKVAENLEAKERKECERNKRIRQGKINTIKNQG